MEVFEIHITGDKSILDVCKELDLKTIEVQLLNPDKSYLRTEYMTSLVSKHEDYKKCTEYVDHTLWTELQDRGVHVVRVKIECPYYDHYRDISCYIESHFLARDNLFPISRNARKETLLATDRRYNKDCYTDFLEKYKNWDVELCLYDNNISEDADWFNLYK